MTELQATEILFTLRAILIMLTVGVTSSILRGLGQ